MTIGKLFPTNTMAKKWNASAFDADTMEKSLLLINAEDLIETENIKLKTPQIAENGAIVPLEITSGLKDTVAVHILVEKNPWPLVASFYFSENTEPFISTRIKMRETSNVMVLAETKSKIFFTTNFVKVTIGGCGEEE